MNKFLKLFIVKQSYMVQIIEIIFDSNLFDRKNIHTITITEQHPCLLTSIHIACFSSRSRKFQGHHHDFIMYTMRHSIYHPTM